MEADLNTSTNFYFLNQNFEVIHKLTQYESLMWVDKYDEPGSFEIYAPPLDDIKGAAQVNNYFMSDKSKHLMIVEKLETTVSPTDGRRLIISGRSLESILDRRVLFMKCYFRDKNSTATPSSAQTVGADNLEDAIRQLLEYLFIAPTHWDNDSGQWVPAEDRKVSNFVFQYSDAPVPLQDSRGEAIRDSNNDPILVDPIETNGISDIHLKDCEFDKGENALNIVNTIVKQAGLGYKITLNSDNQFVFRLIKGKNRCTDQYVNPAVVFSPKFNNLKSSKFTLDSGENFKNFVYTEGEVYKSQRPTIVETGEATGLLRREIYINSEVQHETESSNVTHEGITKQKKKLTEEEYQAALKEDAEKYFKKLTLKTTVESEIEPRLTFQYGRDFDIGDIMEVQDGTGNTGKIRCTEFIISHSSSGYEEYPTFENYTDPEEDEPYQATSSGGEYSEEGKKTSDEVIRQAMELMMPVGYIYQSTDSENPATKFGFGTWKSLSGYFLRGATSGVTPNNDNNDGGADSQTVSSVASHNHGMPSGGAHSHYVASPNGHTWGAWYGSPVAANIGCVFAFAPDAVNSGRCYSGQSLHTESNATYNANHTHTINNNGADYNIATLPKYKNVYIWERIA